MSENFYPAVAVDLASLEIGFPTSTMKANSEKVKKAAGTVAGGVAGTAAGLAGSAATISTVGTVGGLSGAGITTGLTAIGGTILGGAALLTCGVVLAAAGGAYAGYRLFSRKSKRGVEATESE